MSLSVWRYTVNRVWSQATIKNMVKADHKKKLTKVTRSPLGVDEKMFHPALASPCKPMRVPAACKQELNGSSTGIFITLRFDSNFKKKIMGSRKEKKTRPVSTYSFTQVASQDGYDPEDDSLSSISEDEKCGIWCWKPEFLQCFSRPIVFLIVFCFIGLIQGAFFTYFVGVITTVEKRYAFKSKVTGIISIADNLSPVIISLLVGYFGGAGHRTRWVAFGTLIADQVMPQLERLDEGLPEWFQQDGAPAHFATVVRDWLNDNFSNWIGRHAFSAFISSLPYFLFGPSEQLSGSSSANLTVNSTENIGYQLCSLNERIDICEEHASRRTRETLPAVSLLFLGNFINGIGSTAFYIVGTPYLDDNIDKVKTPIYFVDPGIDKTDPRWIGAWWIGFNVIALLLLVAGSLLALFPKKLKWRSDKKSQLDDVIQPSKQSISEKFKGKNKNLITIHSFSNSFMLKNMSSLMTNSNNLFHKGLATVSLMAVGFLVSGFVIYKFKPSARILSGWNVFLGFVQVASMIALANIGCTQNTIATTDSCMEDCRCTNQVFTPVCYFENTTTYFSPCHAGCTTTYFEDKNRVFDNCECTDSIMKTGFCDEGCNSMMLYIAIMAVSKLIGSTGRIGNTLITLRCVSPELKSLALSTGSFLLSLFAHIVPRLFLNAALDNLNFHSETEDGGNVDAITNIIYQYSRGEETADCVVRVPYDPKVRRKTIQMPEKFQLVSSHRTLKERKEARSLRSVDLSDADIGDSP
ncbi:Solute carrier organic anion transporter family member 3A1 [Nymphon striatum]|nr:Solute carrier organic anion transporter family member 3A1 [Nymphon striatum]